MSGDRYKIVEQNDAHFVTFTVIDWVDIFTRRTYKEIIVNNLNYCIEHKGLDVLAWCLMSNHLHAILVVRKGFELSGIIRDYKKHTSKSIVKSIQSEPESRRDWQESNHAIQLSPHFPEVFKQKLNYIHDNPVRSGIVDYAADYLYSSARDYSTLHKCGCEARPPPLSQTPC